MNTTRTSDTKLVLFRMNETLYLSARNGHHIRALEAEGSGRTARTLAAALDVPLFDAGRAPSRYTDATEAAHWAQELTVGLERVA